MTTSTIAAEAASSVFLGGANMGSVGSVGRGGREEVASESAAEVSITRSTGVESSDPHNTGS